MIVGLTGGIGSGKSTVAQIFKSLHIAVYNADESSKEMIDTDADIQQQLKQLLGTKLILADGTVDKIYMASLIFNDKALLQKTNAIIHPALALHFKKWYVQQTSPYIIKEAAILFESGSAKNCDKIIVVDAPEELRIKRVMQRSNITRSEVLQRISKQWPQQKKIELADYIIHNSGNQSVIEQVLGIHKKIKALV